MTSAYEIIIEFNRYDYKGVKRHRAMHVKWTNEGLSREEVIHEAITKLEKEKWPEK